MINMASRILLTILVIFLLNNTTTVFAEKRVALVIGNGKYLKSETLPSLKNPINDADGIAKVLTKLNFKLIGGGVQHDLDKASMENALIDFGEELGEGTIGLFYFAGHGVAVNNRNYLIPVDADKISKKALNLKLISADLVLDQFPRNGGLNIVILDACRNTPASLRGVRGNENEGLVQMNAPSGTLISFATQPGNVALDGKGDNSPYASALMEEMQQPGVGILNMFNRVGLRVESKTDGFQRPWINSSPLEGEFKFSKLKQTATAKSNLTSANLEKSVGLFLSYSTQSGGIALDGIGDNSPYAEALLHELDGHGSSLQQIMRKVRNGVIKATNNVQKPETVDATNGAFKFFDSDGRVNDPRPKFALIIGNSDYENEGVAGDLKNPKNDATMLSSKLNLAGFDTDLVIDADRKAILSAMVRLEGKMRNSANGAIAIFFYAGHAVEVQREQYLIPTDSQLRVLDDLDYETLSINEIARTDFGSDSLFIVISDAVRNNPFPSKTKLR